MQETPIFENFYEISDSEAENLIKKNFGSDSNTIDSLAQTISDPYRSSYGSPIDSTCSTPSPFYFKDNSTNNCLICQEGCNGCTGPTYKDCIECSAGYYMESGECKDCSRLPTSDNSQPRCANFINLKILNKRLSVTKGKTDFVILLDKLLKSTLLSHAPSIESTEFKEI